MSFLKKLGTILLKTGQVVTGLGPIFPSQQTTITKVQDTLAKIAELVVSMEAIGAALGTTGADKLKAVTPLVSQAILQSDLMTGKKIDNPDLFNSGTSKITDGMVDILNSLKDNISVTQ